jgi:hypothetical protein
MLEDKDEQIISEKEKILEMVMDHGLSLENISPEFKNDKEIVLDTICQSRTQE